MTFSESLRASRASVGKRLPFLIADALDAARRVTEAAGPTSFAMLRRPLDELSAALDVLDAISPISPLDAPAGTPKS